MTTPRTRKLAAVLATTGVLAALGAASAGTASASSSTEGLATAQNSIVQQSPIFIDIGRRYH